MNRQKPRFLHKSLAPLAEKTYPTSSQMYLPLTFLPEHALFCHEFPDSGRRQCLENRGDHFRLEGWELAYLVAETAADVLRIHAGSELVHFTDSARHCRVARLLDQRVGSSASPQQRTSAMAKRLAETCVYNE